MTVPICGRALIDNAAETGAGLRLSGRCPVAMPLPCLRDDKAFEDACPLSVHVSAIVKP